MSALSGEWAEELVSIRKVSTKPPAWAVPGFFPPGMSLLVADPKTYKSTLMLQLMASIVEGATAPPTRKGRSFKMVRGTAVYYAYEQSIGRLRWHYETRILKRAAKSDSLLLVKDPWSWRIEEGVNARWCALIKDLSPTLLVVDPLAHAHDFDENDSKWVKHLNSIRQAALKQGTAVVLVHHTNKRKNADGSTELDFSRARGTSALWGMCDSGHILQRVKGGVQVKSQFKDFDPVEWTYNPPR